MRRIAPYQLHDPGVGSGTQSAFKRMVIMTNACGRLASKELNDLSLKHAKPPSMPAAVVLSQTLLESNGIGRNWLHKECRGKLVNIGPSLFCSQQTLTITNISPTFAANTRLLERVLVGELLAQVDIDESPSIDSQVVRLVCSLSLSFSSSLSLISFY